MPNSDVDEVKNRLNIVDLVGQYVTLKKSGINHKGLCPFHQEKSGSFMVNGDRQIYKCFGCFPADTSIRTDKGLQRIANLNVGDTVIAGTGIQRRIEYVHRRAYEGELIQIQVRAIPHIVEPTVDHLIYTLEPKGYRRTYKDTTRRMKAYLDTMPAHRAWQQIHRYFPIKKVRADELKNGQCLLYPISDSIKPIEQLDLRPYLTKRGTRGKAPRTIPLELPVKDALLKFLGYYIAEGSTHRAYVRFSLGNHEEAFAADIVELGQRLFGLKGAIHRRPVGGKTGLEISICHSYLATIIGELCGKGAANKHIPFEFDRLPPEQQRILIDAIHRGDGTQRINHRSSNLERSITTISPILEAQLRDVLLRCGHFPTTNRVAARQTKDGVNHRTYYTVRWQESGRSQYDFIYVDPLGHRYWVLPIWKLDRRSYHDVVYDLRVEIDHSYVANSFAVSNCNEGGDAFDFVMKMEGLTFPEALQLLADRAGVVLTKQTNDKRAEGQRDEKSRLYRVNQFAARYFAQLFEKSPEAEAARAYLTKRTITAESIKTFQIGFAPAVNRLAMVLREKGVTAQELSRAGNPERFRTRIMFPLTDQMNNVTGFTGRGLTDDQVPKYLNTPETPIFKKARTLYGLAQAKQAMRQAGYAILVEGQMDVVLSHQAGVKEAIASSGTALTEDHLRMIRRYVPTIRFAFDADDAGFKAAERSVFTALDVGLTIELISLPSGVKDVGEMVEKNPADWVTASKSAKPVIDWLMDELTTRHGHPSSAAQKKTFAKEVLPYLARVTDPIEQAHYIAELAQRLRVDQSVIRSSLARIQPGQTHRTAASGNREQSREGKTSHPALTAPLSLVEQLVVLLIVTPAELRRTMDIVDHKNLGSEADQALFKGLQTCYTELSSQASFDSKALLTCMIDKASIEAHDRIVSGVLKLESQPASSGVDRAQEIATLADRLQGSKKELLKRTFAQDIATAEAAGDRQRVKTLMLEFQQLLTKLPTENE